jgi:excisionase family DNA binding protein
MPEVQTIEIKSRPRRLAPPDPQAVTVDDACRISGLGRTSIYDLIAQGKLKSVAIGRRRLVLCESIRDLLTPQPQT